MKKLLLSILFSITVFSVQAQDLFNAARHNDIAQIEQLLEEGADINQANERGFTPLILAVYANNKSAVELLLEKGANPNSQDLSGNTALMGAAFRGYAEMAELLITYKADVNLTNFNSASPLIFAATFGQEAIVKQLLEAGANLQQKDNTGKTALEHAILQESSSIVDLINSYKK